jgi:Fe-S-cluster-containing dehydrogenase component
MSKKAFVIDVARCSGCYNCQLACKDEHCGNDWTPYAKPQPDVGQFWLKVEPHECGTIPKVKVHYIPRLCNHCDDAPCIAAAPDTVYRREDGLVIIDPEKAAGNKALAESCPYGVIYWNDELQVAQKCTGCAHLLDAGAKLPRCVEACPTDAFMFGTEDELRDVIAKAESPGPETSHGPRVHYLNVPKRFIAGTVYDPVDKEVIIGATCRLASAGEERTAVTDEYGDFWFKDLPDGPTYDLTIEAAGFAPKTFAGLCPAEDINLGDIPLEREA